MSAAGPINIAPVETEKTQTGVAKTSEVHANKHTHTYTPTQRGHVRQGQWEAAKKAKHIQQGPRKAKTG